MSYCSANPVMSSSSQPKMTCHSTSRGEGRVKSTGLKAAFSLTGWSAYHRITSASQGIQMS